MPRKQYMVDLAKAQSGVKPAGITDIKPGDDDGQFVFDHAGPALDGISQIPVSITAMIPDLSDYPKDHIYMIYCHDDAPKHIGEALQTVRGTDRKTVFELIDIVSATLSALSPDSDGDTAMHDSQFDDQIEEDSEEEDIYGDDDESFSFGGPIVMPSTAHVQTTSHSSAGSVADRPFRDRIRSDLRAAKEAGFKVGHLGHLLDGYNSFVTVSIRMSKLGISEEAMQAWQVEPRDYLVLIIQYPNGYKTNEQLQSLDSLRLKPNIGMRVYASRKYKPTLQEAIKAFTKSHRDRAQGGSGKGRESVGGEASSLRDTFISKPLATLLEDNLVPILRFRSTGMDWHGAECWYSDSQGQGATGDPNYIPDKYYQPETIQRAFPDTVLGDQYRQRNVLKFSFPLLAMQFLLRHFVRCTEFCLVCHRKMDSELEAIKPYVCERPLCLFQYMAMGFGPSIEHEILAQPYVVDLLVSFCYSSAAMMKLKEYPDGLALMVPPSSAHEETHQPMDRYGQPVAPTARTTPVEEVLRYEVGFDRERRELIFFKKPKDGCPVSRGSWIVIKTNVPSVDGTFEELHCRVVETTFYPTLAIDEPIVVKIAGQTEPDLLGRTPSTTKKPATPAPTPKFLDATFIIYNQDFQQLDSNGKCIAICKLLNSLPSVKDMQFYLTTNHNVELKNWVERMSPAAVSLLRWIIASNRACIMQVDGDEASKAQGGVGQKQERLYGMKDYMQFRFAMGAPDKEQRFLTEVRATKERLSLTYPTIFAWHGSPLHNWHMIIREGLHFKNTDHGRAYGHGVYHAVDAGTSTGYSGMYNGRYGTAAPMSWPNSILRVTTALALNEIVNAPKEFVSSAPYYVVSQLEWIQTRYLFVQCSLTAESPVKIGEEEKPTNAHPQDPTRTPKGVSDSVVIPASAIKSGRPGKEASKRASSFLNNPVKKLKGMFGDPIVIDDDADLAGNDSDETDAEDLDIMFDEPEEVSNGLVNPDNNSQSLTINRKAKATAIPTDFEAGTLDFKTLPMMPMPTYANSATTKRLMTELKNLAREQELEDPGKLGWYIDVEKIDNVYQWIVELHSFHTLQVNDKPIPLAADMKKQNIKSIVMEIRFGADFPFSPPYIRVIRPHFLSLAQGGGGHIVMGGAMCMELLTNTGWSSVSTMSAVLMQVRMAIGSEPFARLAHSRGDYGAAEAADGYLRACRTHGWKEPPGFQQVAHGMRAASDEAEIL